MKAFCFSLTILCVVQTILALPRPDFGINGDVGNSDKVVSAATILNTEFIKTGTKDITLVSGYNLLATLRTKLMAIGDGVTAAGTALAAQLLVFAPNKNGPVATVFDAVGTKLTDLETLINTGLDAHISVITGLVGNDIELQFDDGFAAMATTIGALRSALATLRTDVNKAKTAAGSSSSVSAAIIKKNIAAKSVSDVILQVRTLRANIPVITYIVDSSLENVKLADEFIVDIEAEAQTAVGDYAASVAAFQADLSTESQALADVIAANIGDDVDTLIASIQTDLDASDPYMSSGINTDLDTINTEITTGITTATGDIATSFTTYSDAVPTLIVDLSLDLGNGLCAPIQTVSEALVANGPYSDFCFSKYSPRVYALLALTINAFDMCFEREVDRLSRLDVIAQRIIIQITFNVEDLLDNLSVCLSVDGSNELACFTAIAPYYGVLATETEEHVTTLTGLVDKETVASFNRLGACLATSLFVTRFQGHEVTMDVNTCMTDGPQP